MTSSAATVHSAESFDGSGAADHDTPYVFGRLPRALTPFPFSTREFARLLILRSRIGAQTSIESTAHHGTRESRALSSLPRGLRLPR